MTRHLTAAWLAALGASVMLGAARPDAAETKKTAAAAVTLTGCLHADGTKYLLKDPKGSDAPKSRNWKTAFITRSTKGVEVSSASSSVKLKDQIGHQVSVTGTRDGETHLKAKSIKRVSASCS